MNFIEAVTALKNGECEGIMANGAAVYKFGPFGQLLCERGDTLSPSYIGYVGDWTLVNPTPKMEEVVIKGYVWPDTNEFNDGPCKPPWMPATLTYSRPVKRKVKKREEIPASAIDWGQKCQLDELGLVKYYREWEVDEP